MALEWLRRADPKLDEHLRTFLFKDGPITEIEEEMKGPEGEAADEAETGPSTADGSLGIGSLRETTK